MKKILLLITSLVLIIACSGGGEKSYSEKSGLLTMSVSKDTISTSLSDELSSVSDETVDITFDYSAFNSNLKALPVVIHDYHISFDRQDCSNCPVPPSKTVASGINLNAGESKTETIVLLSGSDKLSLPLSALRNDVYNPILNANPVVIADQSSSVATGISTVIGQIGSNPTQTYSFGYYNGIQTVFTTYLIAPIEQGSVAIKVNDSQVASDKATSAGQISGSKSGVVQNEEIGTGNNSQRDFTARLYGGISPGTVRIKVSGSQVAVDNGGGSIIGTGVSGTVDYSTGWISLNFTSAPANGTLISVDYSYNITINGSVNYANGYLVFTLSGCLHTDDIVSVDYRVSTSTGTISGNTITFPTVTFSSDSTLFVVRGTVIITLDDAVIGKDDSYGNIVSSSGVNGTVDYSNRIVQISITPVPSPGIVRAYASLAPASGIYLTPVPVNTDSLSIEWGDLKCVERNGVLQYPCSGSINHSTGQISNFIIYNESSQNGSSKDVVAKFQTNTGNAVGGELIGQGDGSKKEFLLKLKYPPIAMSNNDYALTIVTSNGLQATDTGGGILKGNVCADKLSTVDYITGQLNICFSRSLQENENIFAYYRTSTMKLRATVTARGYEIGGDDIELKKEVNIQLY